METWYERNRERILKEKREQYKKDKAFREHKKKQSLNTYYTRKEVCGLGKFLN